MFDIQAELLAFSLREVGLVRLSVVVRKDTFGVFGSMWPLCARYHRVDHFHCK